MVGLLECDDAFGDGSYVFPVDKTKCWAGDTNAAFNAGKKLMSGCGSGGGVYGAVRCDYMCASASIWTER